MDADGLDGSEVVALRFDEPSAADDLATWCSGEVTHRVDAPDVQVILVPGVDGARPAHLDDWIVLEADGTHAVYGPADFAARFEPATPTRPEGGR